MKILWIPILVVLAWILLASGANAAPADFYKGKVLTYICGGAAGSNYDTYARLVSRYMTEVLPETTIVVKNVVGAGHMLATNELYHAKSDGLTIGTFNTGMIYSQLVENKNIKFDMTKFSYIGKVTTDPRAVLVSTRTNIFTPEDLKGRTKLKFATDAAGSSSYNETMILKNVLQWNVDVIAGYNGNEDHLAIMRGEIDGQLGSLSSHKQFVADGHARFIMQVGGKNQTNIRGAEAAMALIGAQATLGRMTAAPPNVPSERLQILIDAYRHALENPKLLADADKAKMPIDPLYGENVLNMVRAALQQDTSTVRILKNVIPE